jgi:hypothetical protein
MELGRHDECFCLVFQFHLANASEWCLKVGINHFLSYHLNILFWQQPHAVSDISSNKLRTNSLNTSLTSRDSKLP